MPAWTTFTDSSRTYNGTNVYNHALLASTTASLDDETLQEEDATETATGGASGNPS